MILETHGYRGKKLWSVSLDHMAPITVKAPEAAAAIMRAAIYYNLDWTQLAVRDRFKVWKYEG